VWSPEYFGVVSSTRPFFVVPGSSSLRVFWTLSFVEGSSVSVLLLPLDGSFLFTGFHLGEAAVGPGEPKKMLFL